MKSSLTDSKYETLLDYLPQWVPIGHEHEADGFDAHQRRGGDHECHVRSSPVGVQDSIMRMPGSEVLGPCKKYYSWRNPESGSNVLRR